MKTAERRRQRLARLHSIDCQCFWCGRPTILVIARRPIKGFPLRATLDHLDHRMSGQRGLVRSEPRTVLACWECNHRRGVEDQQLYQLAASASEP